MTNHREAGEFGEGVTVATPSGSIDVEGLVKPLEWGRKNPIRDNGDLRAHSVVGMYEIGKVAGRVMVMLRCVKRGDADDIDVGSFDTFDAAQAAAQSDYATRILSAVPALIDRIEALTKGLEYAAKGLDMVHNGLMDPTRPRQAVGEVCNHFLTAARTTLSGDTK